MSRDRADRRAARRVFPFWVLQGAEYLLLVALADLSLHVGRGGLLVAMGAAYAVLALTADGPLGVVHLCGRRLHAALVVAVSATAALAPIVPVLRPDLEGIIIVEVIAVGMVRLATLTNTATGPRPVSGTGPVVDATAAVVAPPPPAPPSPTSPAAPSAARLAGRAAGSVSAAVARTSAQHRPAAEEQVKRGIRGAGRLAGKWTSTDDRRPTGGD
jgi:hypothetical protein